MVFENEVLVRLYTSLHPTIGVVRYHAVSRGCSVVPLVPVEPVRDDAVIAEKSVPQLFISS